jgi:hypothetical protein
MRPSPADVLRNVCLASVLEPIPEKVGCTTRSSDLRPTARLEHFLIAGVNIGWDFYVLARRIRRAGAVQPSIIFDIAYKAQLHSFRNRTGNKVNFGIIELLVPIVTAQLTGASSGDEAIAGTSRVLQSTSRADVAWHYRFRKLAKSRSSAGDIALRLDVSTVFDYFVSAPKVRPNDIVFHREIVTDLPLLKRSYSVLLQASPGQWLLDASLAAYAAIIDDCEGIAGVAADYVCVALYLALCERPDATLA